MIPDNTGDKAVIDKVLSGSVNDFEVLVLKYQSPLMALVMRITRNEDASKDIVQNSFVAAYINLKSLKDPNSFYPWLRRVAINNSYSYFRTIKHQYSFVDEEHHDNIINSIVADETPEDILEHTDVSELLESIYNTLPERLQIVYYLREVEGLSYEEVAEALYIPIGTVRSRLFNARRIFKDKLTKKGVVSNAATSTK